MLNFLPKQEKKKLINEYRIHLVVVSVGVIIILLIIAIIGLFPTYLAKQSQANDIEKNNIAMNSQIDTSTSTPQQAQTAVSSTDTLNGILSSRIDTINEFPALITTMSSVFSKAGSNISINSVSINGATVVVDGVALSRSELIDFQNRLRSDGTFASVILPISDLASPDNPTFSMQITLK